MQTVLITGIGGQDGSYLAEMLLSAGYRVLGTVSGPPGGPQSRIDHIRPAVSLVEADLLDQRSLIQLLETHHPQEIYNFAASHPAAVEIPDNPALTGEINGLSVVRWLEAIRAVDPRIRFCQASTAQLYGRPACYPQDETTAFRPDNPYAIAKLYAYWSIAYYRRAHGLFACSSILFNHESPRRAEKFVTRKITTAVARIRAGLQKRLTLADLEAKRDWGYAPDYVQAMWQMLKAPQAEDYVLATGNVHSVRDFCRLAFERADLDYERYVDQEVGAPLRSRDEVPLVGDASKARRVLNWRPSITFEGLVNLMVDSDIEKISKSVHEA